MKRRVVALLVAAQAATSACNGAEPSLPPAYKGPPIPWQYAPFPTVVAPVDNAMSPEKVSLGRFLFYDPILSSDQKVACVTCHSDQWGMSDGLPLSVGVDGTGSIGPGRVGPNMTTRNALTLWNAAFREALFWDGRATSLEEQALRPLEQPNEMNLPPDEAAARVAAVPAYVTLFASAFPSQPISKENIARAIATFERTLVSSKAPYDQYVAGDAGAMSASETHGMTLFGSSGCATCHVPPLFEKHEYLHRIDSPDAGRGAISHLPADVGAFRVPTVRNVRETGPYFHDGSVADLQAAVSAELKRDVAAGTAKPLSDADLADLTAFLSNALMERLQNPVRPNAVPSGLDIPPDGFRNPR